jgi:hypothetical protein
MKQKRIFRLPKNAQNPYTMVSKELVMDTRISPLAFRIMVYLLGQKDTWNVSAKDLIKKFKSSDYLIAIALKELQCYGYINRSQKWHHSGHFYWPAEVYESPSLNPHRHRHEPPKNLLELQLQEISEDMTYPIKHISKHASTLADRSYSPEEVQAVWERCKAEGEKPGGMFFHWLRKDWLPGPEPDADAEPDAESDEPEMTPRQYRALAEAMNLEENLEENS